MIPKPMNDKVIIEPEKASDITEGGIHIPDVAKQKSNKGKIVAVGPGLPLTPHESNARPPAPHQKGENGIPRRPMVLKEGDRVLFPMYAGQEIEMDVGAMGKKYYLIMAEDEVLAVLER